MWTPEYNIQMAYNVQNLRLRIFLKSVNMHLSQQAGDFIQSLLMLFFGQGSNP